jgi:release factor glutamine methyltransferase
VVSRATEATAPPARGATWKELRHWATAQLGDEIAALRLVEEASGMGGARLLLEGSAPASPAGTGALGALVERVRAGEPLQYVLGHWSFRRLELAVGPGALIPRPETEVVAGVALDELARLAGGAAADLGTGSGAIACSLLVEAPEVEVLATDRSPEALAVAGANIARLDAGARRRVRLLEGDWYTALPEDRLGRLDVVVSNPPYVSEAEWDELDPVVRLHEPRLALVGGPSGLDAITAVVAGAPRWLRPGGSLVVEIAPSQAGAAAELARSAGFGAVSILPDLAGRERVLLARREDAGAFEHRNGA